MAMYPSPNPSPNPNPTQAMYPNPNPSPSPNPTQEAFKKVGEALQTLVDPVKPRTRAWG